MEQVISVKKDLFYIQNEGPIKEYDMWRDDIWKDAPRVSSAQNDWADIPKVSSIRASWSPPKKSSPYSVWSPLPTPVGAPSISSVQYISEKPLLISTSPTQASGPSWTYSQKFHQVDPPLEEDDSSWTDAESEAGWVTTSSSSSSESAAPGFSKRGMSNPIKSIITRRLKSPPKVLELPNTSTSITKESSPIVTPEGPYPDLQWKTPEKAEPPRDDLDSSPRTSTPVSDKSDDFSDLEDKKDQYECFKVHLSESPKKLKIRGGNVKCENETIIAGHINMKNMDPFSYTFEEYYLPKINRCFLNLLLHGPAPLMCHEHYDPKNPNNFVSNCHCIPVCNCRANIISNKNLPIGYKYNEDGVVVPSMPAMPPRAHRRDPTCIYTEFV